MSHSQSFIVVFTLSAPIAHGASDHPPFLMLDGLIGYAVAQEIFGPNAFARRRKRNAFIDLPLPLDTVLPGVYAASQGFAPTARSISAVLTRPYDRANIDPFFIKKANGTLIEPDIQAAFGAETIPLPALVAPLMVFFGRGDVEEVARLLRQHIRFLGHKRGAGFGHVVRVDVVPQTVDWSWSRWDVDGIHLHRALPADNDAVEQALAIQWGDGAVNWWRQYQAAYPQSRLATSPPYHDPDRQHWCYTPDHYGLADAADFLADWPGYAPWQTQEAIDDLSIEDIPDDDTMTADEYWPPLNSEEG